MTQKIDPQQALLKAMPQLCRAAVEVVGCKLYAAGVGDESGDEITPAIRDELLAKLEAGQYVAIDADILAFEQRDGVSNDNFIRFRNESLIALGASGKNRPFLKDHEQRESMAAAGRVLTSKTTKLAEGQYEIRQRVRLTAKWAVDLALRDLLFGVSIGWRPTGPVMCSACNAPIYTKCWHWPGDTVTETPQADGTKKYLRDRNGTMTVEWIYTKAELIETSMCPIGAVKLAGFESVRAALSAFGLSRPDENGAPPIAELAPEQDKSTAVDATAKGKDMTKLEAALAAHTELSADERKAFAAKLQAEIDAAIAADPVLHTTKDGTKIRQSDGAIALMLAKQNDAATDREVLAAAELKKTQDAAAHTTLVAEAKALLTDKEMHGSVEVHTAILGAVKTLPEPMRGLCVQSLTAWTAGGKAQKAPGINPEKPAENPDALSAFNAGLTEFQKSNGIKDELSAYEQFVSSPTGKTLKAAYDATRAYGQSAAR